MDLITIALCFSFVLMLIGVGAALVWWLMREGIREAKKP